MKDTPMKADEIEIWDRCVVAVLHSVPTIGVEPSHVAHVVAALADEVLARRRKRTADHHPVHFYIGARYGKKIALHDDEAAALAAAKDHGIVRVELCRCVEVGDDIFTSDPQTFARQDDSDLWYQVASRDKLALAIANSLAEQVEQEAISEQDIGPDLAAQVSQYRGMHTIEAAHEEAP